MRFLHRFEPVILQGALAGKSSNYSATQARKTLQELLIIIAGQMPARDILP
jgi:hypothetical protein